MIVFEIRTNRRVTCARPASARMFACFAMVSMTFVTAASSNDGPGPSPVDAAPAPGAKPKAEQTPAPAEASGAAEASAAENADGPRRKPTPCIPAAKMTIRRDPMSNIDLFESLRPQHPHCVGDRVRPHVISWTNPTPYGQYVFIHHDPLLFEDIPAERYGEAFKPGVQPVVSLVKFVGAVPILPYKISMNHYAVKDYGAYYAYDHHGNLRPGVVEGAYLPDYYIGAPYPKSRFKASLVEIGVATGVVYFLP